MRYWTVIFPRDAEGRRRGAPDCHLHDYLEKNGCRKIVPERLTTYHFTNAENAQVDRNGELFSLAGARAEVLSGEAARRALEPKVAAEEKGAPFGWPRRADFGEMPRTWLAFTSRRTLGIPTNSRSMTRRRTTRWASCG